MTQRRQIVAEFHKMIGKPLKLFSLTLIEPCVLYGDVPGFSRTIYDVDYSRKFGYLFHQSGFGGSGAIPVSGIYHIHGGAKVKESRCRLVDPADKPPWRGAKTRTIRKLNRTRRLRAIPRSFSGCGDLLSWLQCYGIEQESVYCSECRDNMPGDEPCQHCWWCDKIGRYSTPGDPCGCASRAVCSGDEES